MNGDLDAARCRRAGDEQSVELPPGFAPRFRGDSVDGDDVRQPGGGRQAEFKLPAQAGFDFKPVVFIVE